VVNLADLACVLMRATKKVVNFLRKKCTPRENPGYAYVVSYQTRYTQNVCIDMPLNFRKSKFIFKL